MNSDYQSLVQEDADGALSLLDEYLAEAADGASSRLVDWVRLLHAFYSAEEYDIFIDALEDLPEDCPPGLVSVLLSLHESEPEFVNEAVAVIGGHQCLTEVELQQLMSMREEPNVGDSDEFNASKSGRASVAECPNSTEGMLLELAADPRWEIRYRVAMNAAITQPVQDALVTATSIADDDGMGDYVLAALAVNRKTSQPVLELLAANASPMVREAVALRDGLPVRVATALLDSGTTSGARPSGQRLVWWDTSRSARWMANLSH